MKSLKNFIIESLNEHIEKFIDFLKDNSEIGKLKDNHKSYYNYFNKCNPFDNPKFSLNISFLFTSNILVI